MIYGPVRTTRIAYRRRGKENLYPQDAELNWGEHAYSAGIVARNAGAVAAVPFEQAAEQVSAQGAIRLGKRQCEELAIAAACDFDSFYASRLPEPCDLGTGLLLTADGSPVLIDLIHPEARSWVKEQTAKILAGKHRDVRAGIRRRATTYGYSPAERAGADECAAYLENKQDYLDYPAFLAAGWPIASGLIEGAARWLIKDRMEVTGARWGLDSAEAVLRLRALRGNGDLDDYLDYHFQQEKHRNHDSRYQQTCDLAA
jgi:hypothetical protein